MSLVKFVKGTEANITKLKSSSSVKEGALYVATDKGTMWLGTSATTLLQIQDNIDTTYSTGTATVAGLTKLYSTSGTAADGTMTQVAITDAIKSATGEASLPSGFPEIKSYDYNVEGSLAMAAVGSAAATSDDCYMTALGSAPTEAVYAVYMRAIGDSAPTYFPRVGDKSYFYLEKSSGTIYRWVPDSSAASGSYVAYLDTLSLAGAEDVAVGQYAFDAYYGNKAYQHSLLVSGNPHKVTKEDLGLNKVENKSSEMIRREITKDDVITSLGFTPVNKITGSDATTVTEDEDGNVVISSPQKLPAPWDLTVKGEYSTSSTSSTSFSKNYNGDRPFVLNLSSSGIIAKSIVSTTDVTEITLSVTPGTIGTYTSKEIDNKIEAALTMQSF